MSPPFHYTHYPYQVPSHTIREILFTFQETLLSPSFLFKTVSVFPFRTTLSTGNSTQTCLPILKLSAYNLTPSSSFLVVLGSFYVMHKFTSPPTEGPVYHPPPSLHTCHSTSSWERSHGPSKENETCQ